MTQNKERTYYNVIIPGNNSEDKYSIPAKFRVTLPQSVVRKASDYKLFVQKWRVDSESIPLFHVDLLQPQPPVTNNTNFLTNYNVYVVSGGTVYSSPILFSRPNAEPATVMKMSGTMAYYNNISNTFAIYFYQPFLDMVNAAISTCYSNAGLPNAPFFLYNNRERIIKFYTVDGDTTQIYFSANLSPYVGSGFVTEKFAVNPPGINKAVFQITVERSILGSLPINSLNYIVMEQEFNAISSWHSIDRLLFVSNNLPVKSEYFPFSKPTGILKNNGPFNYDNMSSLNIISSYMIETSEAGDHRTTINYGSTNIDDTDFIVLTGNSDVKDIDIEVFWSDKFGNVIPITLAHGTHIDLRLVFIQK